MVTALNVIVYIMSARTMSSRLRRHWSHRYGHVIAGHGPYHYWLRHAARHTTEDIRQRYQYIGHYDDWMPGRYGVVCRRLVMAVIIIVTDAIITIEIRRRRRQGDKASTREIIANTYIVGKRMLSAILFVMRHHAALKIERYDYYRAANDVWYDE